MGMMGLMKLEGPDIAAYVLAGLAGYATSTLIPDADVSVFVSILVAYHLFLLWLLISQSEKTGLAMPLWATALTHAACMVVVITPATMLGRSGLTFGLFRYGIAGLALFERNWLFSKEQRMHRSTGEETAATPEGPRLPNTAEDELAWLEYLRNRRPGMTRAGTSIQDEHEAWLRARYQPSKRRSGQQAAAQSAATASVAEQSSLIAS